MKKDFITIFLIFLVVLTIASAAVYFYTQYSKDLKTYSAGGVSFQYPADWNLQNASIDNISVISISDPDFNQTNGTKGGRMVIMVAPQNQSIYLYKIWNSTISNATKKQINSTNSTITIAGTSANSITFLGQDNEANETYLRLIDFTQGEKSFLIFMAAGGGVSLDITRNNFEGILKSFQVE